MDDRIYTQVSKKAGRIDRVRDGQTPVVDLLLQPGQYIVSFELEPVVLFHSERKTVDWTWEAIIVTPLPRIGQDG